MTPYWIASPATGPLEAGELLSDLPRVILKVEDIGVDAPRVDIEHVPFVVVLSQACDIEWDYKARGDLVDLGAAPAETSREYEPWKATKRSIQLKLMQGIVCCVGDLEEAVQTAAGLSRREWRKVTDHQVERYQVLRDCPTDLDRERTGFPSLVLDFKRYFTVPNDELDARVELPEGSSGRASRRAHLGSPFLEHLASRFYNFQSRVALPDEGRPATEAEAEPDTEGAEAAPGGG